MKQKDDFRKAWIVFAFGRSGEGFTYYELKNPEDKPFDEQSQQLGIMTNSVAKKRIFDRKLFKRQSHGAIFQVELSDGKISYNQNASPVNYWMNNNDRSIWRLRQAEMDGAASIKKEASRNDLQELLKPITNEYNRASRERRRVILAEVIRIITS